MSEVRVLFLLNSFGFGGAQKQVISLCNAESEIRKDILYLGHDTPLISQVDPEKATLYRVPKRGKFHPKTAHQITEIVHKGSYSILVPVNEYMMIYAWMVKRKLPATKVAVALHGKVKRKTLWNCIKNQIYKNLYIKCDKIIFVSKNQRNQWLDEFGLGAELLETIHNGIDPGYFHPDRNRPSQVRSALGISENDLVIGNIARFGPEKKQETILHAAAQLRTRGLPLQVLFVGDGEMKTHLRETATTMGLDGNVHFPGFQDDVRPYLAAMDCFVLSSTTETFSLAGLEAMSFGLPLILTDVGGASEMVENGYNGYLYPPDNPDALAERLKRIMEPGKIAFFGRNGRAILEKSFTIESMRDKYDALFSRMSNQSMCGQADNKREERTAMDGKFSPPSWNSGSVP